MTTEQSLWFLQPLIKVFLPKSNVHILRVCFNTASILILKSISDKVCSGKQKPMYMWQFSHQVVSDPCDPTDHCPPVSSVHGMFQGIFLTQGSNLSFLHCRQILLPTELPEKPQSKTYYRIKQKTDFLVAQTIKNLPAMRETWVQSLGQEDLLEKGMATHSSILAWRIPWTEEPGGLQSIESQRVRHD